MINRSYPRYRGYLVDGDIHAPGIEPGTWTNPRTSFSSRWFRIDWDTCHVTLTGHVSPSKSSLPLPHDAILLYGTTHDFIFCWAGGWKIQRFMWCFLAPHPRFSDQFNANRQDSLKQPRYPIRYLLVPGDPTAFLETVQEPRVLQIR